MMRFLKPFGWTSSLLAAAVVGSLIEVPVVRGAAPAAPAMVASEVRILSPNAAAQQTQSNLQTSALEAVGEEEVGETGGTRVAAAIKVLRNAGPAGLEALFAAHGPAILQARQAIRLTEAGGKLATAAPSPAVQRLRSAIDAVAMQRDAIWSQLYWYTDMEAAKAEAIRTGKAILSLRMLGKLNEDLSCANSRFFRTTLYSNEHVSAFLRQNFVLYWESVRPVPVITIDMGDGRKIVRTITGNSIHYVLDAKGRVIDALPGLYGAEAFLNGLESSVAFARTAAGLTDAQLGPQVRILANERIARINAAWTADLAKLGVDVKSISTVLAPRAAANGAMPTAVRAAPIAIGKGDVERPMLAQIMPDGQALDKSMTDELWVKIAALHANEAVLDASARQLVEMKSPDAAAAMPRAFTKSIVETPMLKMIRNLQDSIALDTVKNEYQLHAKICEWLAGTVKPVELKSFNERVYADLFLTPSADKWLGLVPADTFSALDNDGLVEPAVAAH